MIRFAFNLAALVSAAVLAGVVVTWPCPPCDVVQVDRPSGFVYVGTVFGQVVVDVHTAGRRVGERFGPDRGFGGPGLRVRVNRSLDRDNRVVAVRVPLLLAGAVALPLPAAWAAAWWWRQRRAAVTAGSA